MSASAETAEASKGSSQKGGAAKKFVRVVLLPALLGASLTGIVLYVPPAGWTTNDVTTGAHPGYPDLQTRHYDVEPPIAIQYAAAAASTLPHWKVMRTEPDSGKLRVEVKTALSAFTDDLTVTATPAETGSGCQVVIRSRSRVGFGDLGENARHIRALQTAMDKRLPR